MRKVALFLLVIVGLTTGGCQDDEPAIDPALAKMLQQLESPVTVRNDLATGLLPIRCRRFYLQDPTRDPVGILTIAANSKSDRVQWAEWQATGRIRNFTVGQHHRYEVYYRDDNLIDSVAYSRPDRGTEGRATFQYYYQHGILHRVEAQSASTYVQRYYFSYQADGRVDRLFSYTGSDNDFSSPELRERSFKYDSLGNIVKLVVKGSGFSTTITYIYDTSANPFQGLFALEELLSIAFPYALSINSL